MARDRGEVRIVTDGPSLFHAGAEEFAGAAAASIDTKGSFLVALSGGSTPRGMFALLAGDEFRTQVRWEKVFFFWGDERHVSPDHPDSNFRMAREALLSHLSLRDDQVFRIHGENPDAAAAAYEYEVTVRQFFGLADGQFPRFDLVLLGMGPDGHTASLFPGTKALLDQTRVVVANWVGKFNTYRITMTASAINAAARVLFLISGEDKAPALKAVLEGPREPSQLPAQLIQPADGSLVWLCDRTAAQLLQMKKEAQKMNLNQEGGVA
jgi:6-phosphogluconolactonase